MVVPQAAADEGDPPSRVARLSYLHGSVSMQPAGASEWTEAVVNRPLTTGDKLWTDGGARVELHAGAAAIHLNGRTGFSFLNLDDNTIQIRLTEGSINLRVRELRTGEIYEVDTPNLAFTVTQAGNFRIDANENGDVTSITAFRGEGEVVTDGQTYVIRAGDRADFTGVENPRMETSTARGPDDFDRWAMDRDAREDHSLSAKYVSRDVIGYEDLDDHGTWRDSADYGHVWYPTVAVGWAPYRYGHWVWISPWGWTWVGDEPWGFAPFHYGRWAYIGGYWGWCPGPFFGRPYFAPALVGFVGGRHFGFGFGFGGPIGWFPLGYGEPFYPGFRCSRVFITNINIHNTVIRDRAVLNNRNLDNFHFANQHIHGAITAVPHSAFVNSQSVARASRNVSIKGMETARVNSNTAIPPNQHSQLGVRGAVSARVPAGAFNRSVVTRSTPAPGAQSGAFHSPTSGRVSANSSVNRPSGDSTSKADLPAGNMGRNSRAGNDSFASKRAADLQQDKPHSGSQNEASQSGSGSNRPRGDGAQSRVVTNDSPGMTSRSSNSTPQSLSRSADRPPSASPQSESPRMRSDSLSSPADRAPSRSDSPRTRSDSLSSSSDRAPSRSYSPPSRSDSPPSRSSSAPSGSNSAPSRSYTPPSRSFSPPSRSSSGGGGGSSSGRSSGGSSGGSRGSSSGSSSRGSSGSSSGSSSHGNSGSSRGHR